MANELEIPKLSPGGFHGWSLEEGSDATMGLPALVKTLPPVPVTPLEYHTLQSEGDLQKIALPSGAIIAGDLTPDRMKIAASYFNAAIQMLCEFECRKPSASGFKLYLYRMSPAFKRTAAIRGAANAESLYDPRTFDIHMPWPDEASEAWAARLLFHETVHAWMHDSFGMTSPLWFCEGLAEYFSTFTVQDGRPRPGAVLPSVFYHLPNPRIRARDLMGFDRERFYGAAFQMLYASAWALVTYLMEEQPADVSSLLNQKRVEVSEAAYGRFYKRLLALGA